MLRRVFLVLMMVLFIAALSFAQAGALRDYVGLISIHYHPDVIEYMGKFKDRFEKRGLPDAAKSIDNYLRGISGSGFAYVDAQGNNYILTNNHVIKQSDSLSVVFEKQDGAKTQYNNLRVLVADEDKDIAILIFDRKDKPFSQGLSFVSRPVDDGDDVFAAGFPGLGNTALWQFSKGTVSNASVRLPTELDGETIGPYIQHTAQIDPGNSGGPLLIALQGVPTGYAVAGINTLSAFRRQAANYAIPVDQVQAFLNAALSTEPVNEKEILGKRVDAFIAGLRAPRAVYEHIGKYLTGACTAGNAEYAISELLDKAPRSVLDDIDETFSYNPVNGMNHAVGWLIETTLRSKAGNIKAGLESISNNGRGGYTVTLLVNGQTIKSEWSKEYGIWRIDTFGDLITGDKSLLEEKEQQKLADERLRTDYTLVFSMGYAGSFDGIAALAASIKIGDTPLPAGVTLYYAGEDFFQLEGVIGFRVPIRLNNFALIPFGDGGFGIMKRKYTESGNSFIDDTLSDFPDMGFSLKAGLMVTTSMVPGLFAQIYYQRNFYMLDDAKVYDKDATNILSIGIGYGF
jgi:serine protease Do